MITPVHLPKEEPRIYIDVPICTEDTRDPAAMECWSTLSAARIGDGDIGPLFRIEGPLSDVIEWLSQDYMSHDGDIIEIIAKAGLARQ